MDNAPSKWAVVQTLLKGPGRFILGYSLAVLFPLILVRFLSIEHKGGQFDLAVGSGMVAFMILLLAFFFSGRFEWLNGKRGMDLMLKFHRRIVFISLILVILHVVLVAPSAMPDLLWPVFLAFFLLLIMIVIAKLRRKIKIKYEIWRMSHGVMAITIIGLICFHTLSEGHYSAHPVMVAYWVILTLIAVMSLPYVHGYMSSKSKRYPYKVTQVQEAANKQWTIDVEPDGFEAVNFLPGQFAFVGFDGAKKSSFHPFSFASAPSSRPKVSFTIKETGDFTETIGELEVGSKVFIQGPYGYMTRDLHRGPENRGRGLVLIAGGIGITPMISMLREMKVTNDRDPVKLFYACRTEEDVLYREELENLASELNLELHLMISKPDDSWSGETGRLYASYLKEKLNFPNYNEYLYFVCGTTSFVKDTVKNLDGIKGIPFFNIRYEDFSVYN